MAVYEFASGIMTGLRNDISGLQTPRRFGVLQDVTIDFAGDIKALFGTGQYAVDSARGKTKIDGKAKFGAVQASAYNELFFGQTLTAGSKKFVYNERVATIGSATTTITYTAANATTLGMTDQGVFYGGTGANAGVQLTATTTSPPGSAHYNFATGTGVFTLDSTDSNASMLFNYTYSTTAGYNIAINQQLMGFTPRFGITLMQISRGGDTGNSMVLELYSNVSSKLSYPTRLDDYTISEMDFSGFANAADQVGVWNLAQ